MKLELAVTIQYLADMGQLVEVVVHTLQLDHQLAILIDGQRLVFQTLRSHLYLRQLAYLGQHGVVGRSRLTLDGGNLQLRVHLREQ